MTEEKNHDQKIVAIIQARMGSNRLPDKVLKDICGYPMLDWVVTRTMRSSSIDDVMVATSTDMNDDPVAAWCEHNHIQCFRGSALDVLDRFYQAAVLVKADVIIRLTADCPLIDPNVIDAVVELFLQKKTDFAANRLPPPFHRTYPIGLDVEVVSFRALEQAWYEASKGFEREHVLPYLYAREGRFKIAVLDAEQNYGDMRWTVDTRQDLEFIRTLLTAMHCNRELGWMDILQFLNNHPELAEMNADVKHKSFTDVDERVQKNDGGRHG